MQNTDRHKITHNGFILSSISLCNSRLKSRASRRRDDSFKHQRGARRNSSYSKIYIEFAGYVCQQEMYWIRVATESCIAFLRRLPLTCGVKKSAGAPAYLAQTLKQISDFQTLIFRRVYSVWFSWFSTNVQCK